MSRKENIVAIIPARYGSTRLPAKPLLDLAGKPMVQHVYERTKKAKLVEQVIVATDDERVVRAVEAFQGEVVMTPRDVRSGSDRVALVAGDLPSASIIVNVQGDEPLIEPAMIDEAIRPLVDDETILVGTLVKRIDAGIELANPNIVKVVLDTNGFAMYFSRSPIPYGSTDPKGREPFVRDGKSPEAFYKHIGLYVFRRDFLLKFASLSESTLERVEKLEQLRILEHGYRIKATVTKYDSVPVDTLDDAERVAALLARKTVNVSQEE